MVIDPIGGKPIQGTQEVKSKNISAKEASIAASAREIGSDSVVISEAGKQAALVNNIKKAVKEAAEVRKDRVEVARKRLAQGDYLTEKVAEKIAEKIAQMLVGR